MTKERFSHGSALALFSSVRLGGQLGLMRPTFSPEGEEGGGGGFELPEDTPFDPGYEPAGGGEEREERPARPERQERRREPELDPDGDPIEADDLDEDADEEQPERDERPDDELTAEELRARLRDTQKALRAARARGRVAGRQHEDAAPVRREQAQPERYEPEELINPDDDPVGAIQQAQRLIRAYQENEAAREESAAVAARQANAYRQIEQALNEYEADFSAVEPNYGPATEYLTATRARELAAMGVPQADMAGMIRQEYATTTARAIRAGKDPAEVFYNMALNRGFRVAGRANALKAEGGKPAASKTPSLDRIRQGQKLSSPLSRGSSRARAIDADTVAHIDISTKKGGEVFDKAWEALEGEAKRAERARGGSRR